MARNKKKAAFPRGLAALALAALLLFLGGEAWLFIRSGQGQLKLARWGLLKRAQVSGLLAREIRAGLEAAGIPPDSVRILGSRERAASRARRSARDSAQAEPVADTVWRIGLKPGASLLQANYAVSRRVEALGGEVLNGTETSGPHRETLLRLTLGWRRNPLHQLVFVSAPLGEDAGVRPAARLALVLFGFGEDLDEVRRFCDLGTPFALALVPGSRSSGAMFRAAHEKGREVVLHLPLEPVNYPQVNPGPGTLLVTMSPDRVTGTVRRWVEQGSPLVAAANHMGSFATQDVPLVTAVYRELHRSHLPFIHMQAAAGAVCRDLAADMGVVYEQPGAVLDQEARGAGTKALDGRWKQILETARKRGRMTVWVRATPLTRAWLGKATAPRRLQGVELAPLSGVMRVPAVL